MSLFRTDPVGAGMPTNPRAATRPCRRCLLVEHRLFRKARLDTVRKEALQTLGLRLDLGVLLVRSRFVIYGLITCSWTESSSTVRSNLSNGNTLSLTVNTNVSVRHSS